MFGWKRRYNQALNDYFEVYDELEKNKKSSEQEIKIRDIEIEDLKKSVELKNKNINELEVKLKNLSNDYKEILAEKDRYFEEIKKYDSTLTNQTNQIVNQEQEIEKLKQEKNNLNKKLKSTEDHLQNFITKSDNLELENESLKNKIKELESDRYLKVELPPDKPKKTKMGIKRGAVKIAVKQELKKKNESEEK